MRGLAGRLLLAVSSVCLLLVAAEGAVRVLQRLGVLPLLSPLTFAPADPYAVRLVRSEDPTLVVELDAASPLVNADGLRDRDYARVKPADTFRIAVLGDSFTFGLGVPLEQTYAKRLEQSLNERAVPPLRYEVINFGVSGYGTLQEVELLKRKVLAYGPDLVLVGYVLNDPLPAELMIRAVGEMQRRARRFPYRLAPYSQVLTLAFSRVDAMERARSTRADYPRAYAHPTAWGLVESSFAELARLGREHSMAIAVAIFPLLQDFDHYPFGDLHRQVAEALDRVEIPHVDLFDAFRTHDARTVRLFANDAHPNPLGHAIAAGEIERFLDRAGLLPRSASGATGNGRGTGGP